MKSTLFQLLTILSLLVATITGYVFWYHFVTNESVLATSLAEKIHDERQTAVRANATANALAKLAADESAVLSYFVSESNIVSFLGDLQEKGAALGSKVSVLSVSATKDTNPSLSVSLSVEGKFDAVLRTIGVIEYAPYHLVVNGVDMSKTGSGTWTANLGVTVGSLSTSVVSPTTQSL